MSWDPFQRAVLAELGLVTYRTGAASVAPGSEQLLCDGTESALAVTSPMLARVARAAGLAPEAFLAAAPALAAASNGLVGDAAAKRALWPQLRCLRREHG